MIAVMHDNSTQVEEKVFKIAPGVDLVMCWCPAGEFVMGSPESEEDRDYSDEDQVKVTLSKGFWIGKYVVTQAQWQVIMGTNPSELKGENLPVVNVSWDDTQEFIANLNKLLVIEDGLEMALPTEAQWEYACRAGEEGPYSGGTIDEVAWYADNSKKTTHAVGQKKPNRWGLYDMHGNVQEWCQDFYASELVGGVDPQGAASGSERVCRGGGYDVFDFNCRAADRVYFPQFFALKCLGFRLVRSSAP